MPLVQRFLLGAFLLSSTFLFAGDPQWVEVRSPNFSVITDAGDKRGRDVALHFEQMRSVFGTLMTRANVNLSVPLQIVAFRNSKELRQMSPLFHGKPTELAGLFQGGQDRCFIMLDMSTENPWSVVFHEYAHRLMDGNIAIRADPWFEEGFAEYFSSIEVDNKQARVGKIPNETYQILMQLGMMKVYDLFRVQQNTSTYNESGDHRTTFYAESSLVVHYLYDNKLILKLATYYDALQVQKKPVDQAIQTAFGMTPDQFDKALRGYLSSGRYMYYPIPTPAGIMPSEFKVTPVSPVDARALLADIHAHSPDYRKQALGEFQEVLKTEPDNADALRGVGYLYLQQQDFEHAGEYFKKAAQKNSKDPRVHLYYAMLLSREGVVQEEKSAEIKKELEAAVALDPKLADAYSLLGFTQAMSGEPEKGMASLKRAVELAPRNDSYQFNLANVYLVNHKVDEAIVIYRSLTGSSQPDVAFRAQQGLEQAVRFKEMGKTYEVRIENGSGEPMQLVRRTEEAPGKEEEVATVSAPIPVSAPPVRFLKGKLMAVDCSASPQAVLTVTSGAKSLKLRIADREHVVLIGEDKFSCDWKSRSVSVNYREVAAGDGDVVSLEVQ